jgi:hypothetical protein
MIFQPVMDHEVHRGMPIHRVHRAIDQTDFVLRSRASAQGQPRHADQSAVSRLRIRGDQEEIGDCISERAPRTESPRATVADAMHLPEAITVANSLPPWAGLLSGTKKEEHSMKPIKIAPVASTHSSQAGGKVTTGGEAPSFGPTRQPTR